MKKIDEYKNKKIFNPEEMTDEGLEHDLDIFRESAKRLQKIDFTAVSNELNRAVAEQKSLRKK